MKTVLYNESNLKKEEINKIVKRAKLILVNSNNEILLGYCNNNYQLPGGHVEKNETYEECLIRELMEETGINLNSKIDNLVLKIIYMNKDYPNKGDNTKYICNYYSIKSDLKPNLNLINLTKEEKDGNFYLRYININNVIEELESSLENCTRENVVKDTIAAINEYIKKECK